MSAEFAGELAALIEAQKLNQSIKQSVFPSEDVLVCLSVTPTVKTTNLLDHGPVILCITINQSIKKSSDGTGQPKLHWIKQSNKQSINQSFSIKKSKPLKSFVALPFNIDQKTLSLKTNDKSYDFTVNHSTNQSTNQSINQSINLFVWMFILTCRWSFSLAPSSDLDPAYINRFTQYCQDATSSLKQSIPQSTLAVISQSNNPSNNQSSKQTINQSINQSNESIILPPMSQSDAENLKYFLSKKNLSINQLHSLESMLTNDLIDSDKKTLQAMFEHASHQSINQSTNQSLDSLIEKADELSMWMRMHDTELTRMRLGIARIEEKNSTLEQQSINQSSLFLTIKQLINQLTIDDKILTILEHPDFTHRLTESLSAAKTLDSIIDQSIDASLSSMRSVKERRAEWSNLKRQFASQARAALEQAFLTCSKNMESTVLTSEANAAIIDTNQSVHSSLGDFASLARFDPEAFTAIRVKYSSTFAKPYETRIKAFFQDLKKLILNEKHDSSFLSFPPFQSALITAPKSINQSINQFIHKSNNTMIVRGKQSAPNAFKAALICLVPIIESEETFLTRFFDLDAADPETQRLMGDLFGCLIGQFNDLCYTGSKMDPFYALEMEVGCEQFLLEQSMKSNQSSSTHSSLYFTQLHTMISSQVKHVFNRYIDDQLSSITSLTVSPKRAGVLMPFQQFPSFVARCETIVNQSINPSYRSTAADTAYAKLSVGLFRWLDSVCASDEKYRDVCWVENAAYYLNVFTQQFPHAIPALQTSLIRAREGRDAHLMAYIDWNLDYEMHDVIKFWSRLNEAQKTIAAEDLQHARDLSKHELRTITKDKFTPKTLAKHMTNMQQRIRKHLGKNEAMIDLIWTKLVSVLKEQVNWFQQAIARSYPGEELQVKPQDVK